MKISARFMAQAAVIAALYTALTLLLAPFSFGTNTGIELRVAEALTLLPVLTPAAIPGLFVGCLLSNAIGMSMGVTTALDVAFGPIATLLAALLTRKLRKLPVLAALPPVVLNAFIVGGVVAASYHLPYWLTAGQIGIGQCAACFVLGLPLLWTLKKLPQNVLDK